MIRIFKDKDTMLVTKGAYEQFYKPLGYNIVVENKPLEVKKPVVEEKTTIQKKTTEKKTAKVSLPKDDLE